MLRGSRPVPRSGSCPAVRPTCDGPDAHGRARVQTPGHPGRCPGPRVLPKETDNVPGGSPADHTPCLKAGSAIPPPHLEDSLGRGPCSTQSHGGPGAAPACSAASSLLSRPLQDLFQRSVSGRPPLPSPLPSGPAPASLLAPPGRGRGRLQSLVTEVPTCWPSSSGGLREARSRQGWC